jgi:hypothetical protein
MSRRLRPTIIRFVPFLAAAFLTRPAGATYHTYRVAEVYSNPSGTVQFIEMHEVSGAGGQNLVSQAPDIRSGSHTFVFPSDLPNANTANSFFLLGTAGYNAITGAPRADFTITSGFLNPAGDTLQYGSTGPDGVVDLTSFGALPSDPRQALFRQGTSGNIYTTGQAVANTFSNGGNFAVPEPGAFGLIGMAALGLMIRRRRAAANS